MNELQSGINICCHYELSFITEKENKIYFPSYFLEDYFIDFFEDNNIKYFYLLHGQFDYVFYAN